MDHAEADRLFRRFQETHDPTAIAAVYDGLAPELLLIAAHLGHRSGDAEDLVQNTFLAALEMCDRFDSERRLMPWLIGILVNQARRENRRRRRLPDPARLEHLSEIDPALAAEDAEFRDELARQLRALPKNYRLALTLRWVHGLSPVEIAHALGDPPETVRTRLRRGQEILRQALPVGFAAAAFMVSGGSALAAGRAAVVQRAEELATAAAATSIPAASVVGTSLLPTGLAIAGVLAVAVWWSSRETTSDPPVTMTSILAEAPSVQEPSATLEAGADREAVPTPIPPAATQPGRLALDVRFADGSPAALVGIGASNREAADPLLDERWIVTDAAGQATMDGLEAGTYDLIGDRAGAWSTTLSETEGARAVLVIPSGVTMSGVVRGVDGAPLPGARIWISRPDAQDEGRTVTRTGADGRFDVRAIAKHRCLGVFADGYLPRPLERIEDDAGTDVERMIDLADLASPYVLRGTVTSAAGRPLADARVQIGRRLAYLDFDKAATGRLERSPPIVTSTDEAGTFEARGVLPFEGAVEVWARARGHAGATTSVSFGGHAPPEVEVAIPLPPARRLRGRTWSPDGTPCSGARVVVRAPELGPSYEAPRWAQLSGWSSADGEFELDGVPRGSAVATARGPDGAEASFAIDAGERDVSWDAHLQERRPMFGVVTDDDGVPLADVTVRALVGAGRVEPTPARSDDAGRFRLEGTLDREYDVWVADDTSAWSGSLVTRGAVHPDQSPLALVVDRRRRPTAAITGRVLDRHDRPIRARLMLGNLHVGAAYTMSDEQTGRFRFGPIPALDTAYHLLVMSDEHGESARHPIEVEPHQTVDLEDVVIEPRGRVQIRCPVEATARISSRSGMFHAALDLAGGNPATVPLAPGTYVLHLTGDGNPLSPTPFTVEAERTTDVELEIGGAHPRSFVFTHADDGWDLRLDLEWCDDAGRVLARRRVQWPHDGPLALTRSFSPGEYRLRARSHADRRAEARFVVSGESNAPTIRLELD